MKTIERRLLGTLGGAALLLAAAVLPGCSPKESPRAHVSGTVTLDGAPMPDGFVYFKKIDDGAMDRLDVKDGKFEGMVELGQRRVEVSRLRLGKPFIMAGAEIPDQIESIAPRYNTATELSADVAQDGPNEFTFDVKSKK